MEKRYNDWLIINDIPIIKKGKKYFLCECKCGLQKEVQLTAMKREQSKRCSSCAGKQVTLSNSFKESWRGQKCGELNKTLYSHIKSKAKERNLEFNISQQFLWELLEKQNFKCNLSGIQIYISTKIKNGNPDFNFITASVDRINSKMGYTEDNVQWIHKDINKMKMDFPNDYFIQVCVEISKNTATLSQATKGFVEGATTNSIPLEQ